MVLNNWTVEVRRNGEAAKLVIQARPYGLETLMTLEQLEIFALFLASECGKWRDEQIMSSGGVLG